MRRLIWILALLSLAVPVILTSSSTSYAADATLMLEGPEERGDGPVPAGQGTFTIDVYAQASVAIAGMQVWFRFIDPNSAQADGFAIKVEGEDPEVVHITYNENLIGSGSEGFFPVYDDPLCAGFLSYGNVDLPAKAWLFTVTIEYDISAPDPLGTYTIDIDTEYTYFGDANAQQVSYDWVTGGVAFARALYVDDDAPGDLGPGDPAVSDPDEDGSAEHPFDAIAEAINAASDSDMVIVLDGTYTGGGNRDVDFLGRKITVRSQNGPAACVIDCQGTGADPHRAFIFQNGEGPDSVLRGFTVTGGYEADGGAVHCSGSSPRILHNVITGNTAQRGGGIYCANAKPEVYTNTFSGNSAAVLGGALYATSSSVVILGNSILWGDAAPTGPEVAVESSSSLAATYCDVAGGQEAAYADGTSLAILGDGVFEADPEFANAQSGDYHLKSQRGRWDTKAEAWAADTVTSPCIDAGSPSDNYANEPRPNGGRINVGAYANTAQASMSPVMLTVKSSPITGVVIEGDKPGTTNYTATCNDQQQVGLTAPMSVTVGGVDYGFVRWNIDGRDQMVGMAVISVRMTADHTVTAIYEIPHTLTVQSSPRGVSIGGDRPGTTEYAATCHDEDQVDLVAPPTATVSGVDYDFVRWIIDGADQPAGLAVVTIFMHNDRTAVAVYQIQTHTLTVQSTPPGVVIGGDKPGTTQYAETCDDQEVVNLTAPPTVTVGNVNYQLARWVLDEVDQPDDVATISITMDADHTVVAVYEIEPRTLTVQSIPPGVSITGDRPGMTSYEAICDHMEIVNLSAMPILLKARNIYKFIWWAVDEKPSPRGQTNVEVIMDADHSAVATYNLFGDANGDCSVNVLDLIFVRNKLRHNVTTGENWRADTTGDGVIDILDLLQVRIELGKKCTD